jgi:hypothetical protein
VLYSVHMTTHGTSSFPLGVHATANGLPRLAGDRTLPRDLAEPGGNRLFSSGPIREIHRVGPYVIVEYLSDESNVSNLTDASDHGRVSFMPYVDGRRTAHIFHDLDEALVFAIVYRTAGPNAASHVGRFVAQALQGYGD